MKTSSRAIAAEASNEAKNMQLSANMRLLDMKRPLEASSDRHTVV